MVTEKRLIDTWDLIEWLDNFDRENTLRILRGKKAKLLNSHAIKNMIVTVPKVDAVEVVHGRWILADDGDGDVCSVCGTDFCNIIYETGNWNYCPNCGAKMEA
jgi:hypothetical protein